MRSYTVVGTKSVFVAKLLVSKFEVKNICVADDAPMFFDGWLR